MSQPSTIAEPHDDDVIVIFRRGAKGERRKAERMTWGDAKAAIAAALPDSTGVISEIRLQIAGLSKEANEAVLASAKSQSDALRSEAKARSESDAALAARQNILAGVLTLPANLAILAGKNIRTVAVAGVKAGDHVNLTFRAAIPSGTTLGEVYSLKDGEISIVLLAISAVTITSKVEAPFTLAILRS